MLLFGAKVQKRVMTNKPFCKIISDLLEMLKIESPHHGVTL